MCSGKAIRDEATSAAWGLTERQFTKVFSRHGLSALAAADNVCLKIRTCDQITASYRYVISRLISTEDCIWQQSYGQQSYEVQRLSIEVQKAKSLKVQEMKTFAKA